MQIWLNFKVFHVMPVKGLSLYLSLSLYIKVSSYCAFHKEKTKRTLVFVSFNKISKNQYFFRIFVNHRLKIMMKDSANIFNSQRSKLWWNSVRCGYFMQILKGRCWWLIQKLCQYKNKNYIRNGMAVRMRKGCLVKNKTRIIKENCEMMTERHSLIAKVLLL